MTSLGIVLAIAVERGDGAGGLSKPARRPQPPSPGRSRLRARDQDVFPVIHTPYDYDESFH